VSVTVNRASDELAISEGTEVRNSVPDFTMAGGFMRGAILFHLADRPSS
jgi:hypothetical protein